MPRFPTGARTALTLCALLACLYATAARPQTQAAPGDPILPRVDGQPILLSDVTAMADTLPEQARGLPPITLFPMLLDQLIDARALTAEARKTGTDKDPTIQRQVAQAAQRALESALLRREIEPLITNAAVRARYDRDIASKPGTEEVRARHILVDDEALAKTIVADLKKGGDFAALSGKHSKGSGASRSGGDLGFFKRDDIVPEFAAAAFGLKAGEIAAIPVRTQFGRHVIQVIERRRSAPESFDEAKEELRQEIIKESVQKVLARARAAVTVERMNIDGSVPRATDTAEPPRSG